jgi:hypothetical protein
MRCARIRSRAILEGLRGAIVRVSQTELDFAADVRRRDAAIAEECKARGFTDRRGNTSYPSDTAFAVKAPTNEERSRAECIEFRANPLPYGQSYTAYLTKAKPHGWPLGKGLHGEYKITTFTGDTLAFVTRITTRKVRGGYLTNEKGSFWARGIDGRTYHGRHNGSGIYCRMRLAKNQE